MSTIKIADKPTLDNVLNTVESRGGIKLDSSSTKPQVYNTSTDTWTPIDIGGGGSGASPTLIVINKNNVLTNKDITVINSYGFISTQNMSTNSYLTFEVPYLSSYIVKYNLNNQDLFYSVNVDRYGGVVFSDDSIISFSTATDEELSTMLTMHYNDLIDLSTLWSIGDTRTVNLSAVASTSYYSAVPEKSIKISIIDFNHDDLATSINGHTKAIITAGAINSYNYMQCYNTSSSRVYWTNTYTKKLCDELKNHFSNTFQKIIKSVKKRYFYNTTNITTTNNYIWLPSAVEITNYAGYQEGTQYKYYETASNRIKPSSDWWTRTPDLSISGTYYFIGINNSGNGTSINQANVAYTYPHLCL